MSPTPAACGTVCAAQELVTLPEAFFLELDLEQSVLVERSSSSPLSLLRAAAGSKEVELHRLIKVRTVGFEALVDSRCTHKCHVALCCIVQPLSQTLLACLHTPKHVLHLSHCLLLALAGAVQRQDG